MPRNAGRLDAWRATADGPTRRPARRGARAPRRRPRHAGRGRADRRRRRGRGESIGSRRGAARRRPLTVADCRRRAVHTNQQSITRRHTRDLLCAMMSATAGSRASCSGAPARCCSPVADASVEHRADGLRPAARPTGPAILCPNHISFLDSAFLMLTVPRNISFVGKAEYMDSWKTKYLFPAMGMIPIDRSGGEQEPGRARRRRGGAPTR